MLRSRYILAAVGIKDADADLRCVLYNFPEDTTQKFRTSGARRRWYELDRGTNYPPRSYSHI